MIAALKTKGVPVLWVGLPSIRGAKSTSDMSYLDELYRARAEKAGIVYVDIWDGFVDDQGRYAQQGPDFEGQTRRLRTYDGVNFTKYGAEKLAHYVEHELRRVLNSHVVPVALPGPEEQTPAKGVGDAKPAVGPVVPLSTVSSEGGELLGSAKAAASKKEPDALATRVLSRGEALAAPHGRADDFSWPRADISSEPAPDTRRRRRLARPSQGGADKNETNKSDAKGETNRASRRATRIRPSRKSPRLMAHPTPLPTVPQPARRTLRQTPRRRGRGRRSTAARCRGHLCRSAQPRRVRAGSFRKTGFHPRIKSEGRLFPDHALARAFHNLTEPYPALTK